MQAFVGSTPNSITETKNLTVGQNVFDYTNIGKQKVFLVALPTNNVTLNGTMAFDYFYRNQMEITFVGLIVAGGITVFVLILAGALCGILAAFLHNDVNKIYHILTNKPDRNPDEPEPPVPYQMGPGPDYGGPPRNNGRIDPERPPPNRGMNGGGPQNGSGLGGYPGS